MLQKADLECAVTWNVLDAAVEDFSSIISFNPNNHDVGSSIRLLSCAEGPSNQRN